MVTYDNDEAGYLHWIETQPRGYVINAPKRSGDCPDVLHRATCWFISTKKQTNYTTTTFKKLCSLDRQELVNWLANSPESRACKHCKP